MRTESGRAFGGLGPHASATCSLHLYDDVDDPLVFASLDRPDDLRAFARVMLGRLDRG